MSVTLQITLSLWTDKSLEYDCRTNEQMHVKTNQWLAGTDQGGGRTGLSSLTITDGNAVELYKKLLYDKNSIALDRNLEWMKQVLSLSEYKTKT